MKIAFVGKGGSGKTTVATTFAKYLVSRRQRVAFIDADLNAHAGSFLDPKFECPEDRWLSSPESMKMIRSHLRGSNLLISDLNAFVKTTPPGPGSNRFDIRDDTDPILSRFAHKASEVPLLVVGTYDGSAVGTSCYHNNLAILENLLSHAEDSNSWLIVDMVAGIDIFANTLHAQFDAIVIVVEPSRRSVEVGCQFLALAHEAKVSDLLRFVGSQTRSKTDAHYIQEGLGDADLLCSFPFSPYLASLDRNPMPLQVEGLEGSYLIELASLESQLRQVADSAEARSERLHDLHRRYVAQDYVRRAYGDLTGQISEGREKS